jgi:hypothetical protein
VHGVLNPNAYGLPHTEAHRPCRMHSTLALRVGTLARHLSATPRTADNVARRERGYGRREFDYQACSMRFRS